MECTKILLLYLSDHGDGMAAHEWAAKLSFYEESVKVPFNYGIAGKVAAGVLTPV